MDGLTYESIRDETDGAIYPRDILANCEDALCLFSAAFYGRHDAFWLAEAGLRAKCVDTDAQKMAVMEGMYPADWTFVVDDVYELCDTSRWIGEEGVFDLVSLDPGSDDFQRCSDLIDLWCSLARRYVVIGHGVDQLETSWPEGWEFRASIYRSRYMGGVYWSVGERA